MSRRVVITSVGVISSLGFSVDEIISRLKQKNIHLERPSFDQDVVTCPVPGFDIKAFTGRFKNVRYLNRGAQFCVASAMAAIKDAGLDKKPLSEAGLFVGVGPNLDISNEWPQTCSGKIDSNALKALWILRFIPNTAASIISALAGVHGESLTLGTACTASLQAIGEAFRKIKDAYLDIALAGGGDSRLSQGGILAYRKAQALFSAKGDPERKYAPFDKNRNGFVPGEGGAFFLLEELEHARNRGANILGEICGSGSSMDGHSMTAPEPCGKWPEAAVVEALNEAQRSPDEIDVVSAHGTGTFLNDEMEATLIDRLYTKNRPKVLALKSWIGHISAACGAVELAVLLGCLKEGYLPEIRNLKEPCHDRVNFVRQETNDSPNTIVIENFGFGGQNSALVIRKWNKSR